ncbi:MAG: hypothetical protein ACRDS1_18815 [Pseudonocardiaceae bacterium]
MSTPSPLIADALGLLSHDLYLHLDEADSLATQNAEWSPDDMTRARELICDLVIVIRGLLIEHERQTCGDCRICAAAWPCPVVMTIHAFVKDPHRQFVALVMRARDDL